MYSVLLKHILKKKKKKKKKKFFKNIHAEIAKH